MRDAAVLGRGDDRQRARPGHGMQRVLDDVGERARDERAIDEHRRQRRWDVDVEPDAVAAGRRGTARRSRAAAPARATTAGRAVGDEAKLENSDAICRSSLTCVRIVLDALLEHRTSGSPRSACTRRRCSALSWIGVSGFLISCATCRAISAHASSRLRALELGALPLQLARHAVEVLDQPAQLVGRRRGDAGVEIAARDAPRGARQPVHRVGDALGHRVAEPGAAEDEEQRAEEHAAVERVDLRLDLALPRRQRHGEDAPRSCGRSAAWPRRGTRSRRSARARPWPPRSAARAHGRRRRGVRVGSRPDANRLRSLVASSRGAGEDVDVLVDQARLTHTIRLSSTPEPCCAARCARPDPRRPARGRRGAHRLLLDVRPHLVGDVSCA